MADGARLPVIGRVPPAVSGGGRRLSTLGGQSARGAVQASGLKLCHWLMKEVRIAAWRGRDEIRPDHLRTRNHGRAGMYPWYADPGFDHRGASCQSRKSWGITLTSNRKTSNRPSNTPRGSPRSRSTSVNSQPTRGAPVKFLATWGCPFGWSPGCANTATRQCIFASRAYARASWDMSVSSVFSGDTPLEGPRGHLRLRGRPKGTR